VVNRDGGEWLIGTTDGSGHVGRRQGGDGPRKTVMAVEKAGTQKFVVIPWLGGLRDEL
jgi:hypothetical protein